MYRFYILKKIIHTWKNINVLLYHSRSFPHNKRQNTAQLTIFGNETVATSILRGGKSVSTKTCGLNPCKIPLELFLVKLKTKPDQS